MNITPSQFSAIQEFFGADWLRSESEIYHGKIDASLRQGFLANLAMDQTHPVVRLWYKYVLDGLEVSDLVITGRATQDQAARQLHRLLHLEFLLRELIPSWTSNELQEVRERLMNLQQFASTFYELAVLGNFRHGSYDFRFVSQKQKSGRIPDIAGRVGNTEIRVECKRLSQESRHRRKRNLIWEKQAEVLGKYLQNSIGAGMLVIEYFADPRSFDVKAALDLVEDALKTKNTHVREPSGRFAITFLTRKDDYSLKIAGISWRLSVFDLVYVHGFRELSQSDTIGDLLVIGFLFSNPTDWSGGVLRILRDAHEKFRREHCNIICLEIAELPYFKSTEELGMVFSTVERFLARDTRRVTSVVLTLNGLGPPSNGIYKGVSESRFFNNKNAYVPIPNDFQLPEFDWPNISFRFTAGDIISG